jgi:hypothetical protein
MMNSPDPAGRPAAARIRSAATMGRGSPRLARDGHRGVAVHGHGWPAISLRSGEDPGGAAIAAGTGGSRTARSRCPCGNASAPSTGARSGTAGTAGCERRCCRGPPCDHFPIQETDLQVPGRWPRDAGHENALTGDQSRWSGPGRRRAPGRRSRTRTPRRWPGTGRGGGSCACAPGAGYELPRQSPGEVPLRG